MLFTSGIIITGRLRINRANIIRIWSQANDNSFHKCRSTSNLSTISRTFWNTNMLARMRKPKLPFFIHHFRFLKEKSNYLTCVVWMRRNLRKYVDIYLTKNSLDPVSHKKMKYIASLHSSTSHQLAIKMACTILMISCLFHRVVSHSETPVTVCRAFHVWHAHQWFRLEPEELCRQKTNNKSL